MLRAGRGRVATVIAAVAGLLAAGAPGAMALTGPGGTPGQWSMAGQNIDDTHFQAAEHEISPANVGRLAPRWTLTTAGAISATPTVDDGAVYVPDYGGKLWAVAAGSGKVLWSQDISSYTGVAGDLSRTSPAVYGDELILGDGWILSPSTSGARVFAVDRRTGELLWSTQVDTDPNSMITGSPVIYDGVAYLGISSKGEGNDQDSFRGTVIALDAATGRLLWKAYMVPSNNGGSDSNKPGYYSGNAVWESSFAVDPLRGLLYMDTGNNYSVPAGVCTTPQQTGCTPPAADDYVDSILALKLSDGAVAWADHTLNGDLWTLPQPVGPDFDFGAGPNLFTTANPVTGRPEQLVGAGQKSGVYWAVDPATGKVVWQTQVGPAGNGGLGGIEYGTATDGRSSTRPRVTPPASPTPWAGQGRTPGRPSPAAPGPPWTRPPARSSGRPPTRKAPSTSASSAPPTASSTADRWPPPAPTCTPWTPRPGRSCGASPAAAR